MSSIDKKAFGISDSLINAVNEALKGGQVKIDVAEPKGKITGADFKKLRGEDAKPDYIDLDKDGNKKEPMKHAAKQVKEEAVAEAGMPASVIKSKQNRANMTDKQFADSHKNHSDADLRSMAWRHGLGKPGTPGHDHYVNKRNKGLKEDVEQVDELSTDTYHSAAQKAAKRAMGDVQGRSGPIFKKYAGMANKFRAKGMEQEKKEKAMKEEVDLDWKKDSAAVRASKDPKFVDRMINKWGERGNAWLNHPALTSKKKKAMKEETLGELSKETLGNYVKSASADVGHKKADAAYSRMSGQDKQADKNTDKARKRLGGIYTAVNKLTKEETDPGFVAEVQRRADMQMVKVRMPDGSIKYKKVRASTAIQHEANDAVSNQIAAKKDAFKTQLQQKIASKQMNVMQAKANKRLSSINASNDKCSCQEGKGKSMTCEMHGDKSKGVKGANEPININPPMREAAELPKKVVTKGHEIAKSIIKNRAGVDNPYAVGMAQAKKSAKMNAYRADRDKNKED